MNNERNEQMLRVMAVIGFVVMVCLLAWLAVQAVRFLPTAFSSLANIFEANQRDYEDRLTDNDDDNDTVVIEGDNEIVVTNPPAATTTTPAVTATSTVTTTPAPITPVVSKPATSTPVQWKTVVTYKTPVSDPKGHTDLSVSFSAVGYMNSAGRFVAADELSRRDNGAMQFVVKNLGTKTSSDWTFVAELPNGSSMTSKSQAPLKPQESATLTVVFGASETRGSEYVGVTVEGGSDSDRSNNSFRTRVNVR